MLKKILMAAALVIGASPAYAADSYSVYVGYTDNLRLSGFFPSPFCTGNTTTCQVDTADAGVLDGGVFRIDNTGTTPLALTGLTVTLPGGCGGSCVYQLWNDVTLAAGQMGIFGQPTSNEDFDTSDTAAFFNDTGIAINGIGGCTVLSDLSLTDQANCIAHDPIISFNENGNAVSITDSGSILNTGGYDFVSASADGNESINWNLAGSSGTRGGVPEPITLTVFGAGLAGIAAVRRRKKTKA